MRLQPRRLLDHPFWGGGAGDILGILPAEDTVVTNGSDVCL